MLVTVHQPFAIFAPPSKLQFLKSGQMIHWFAHVLSALSFSFDCSVRPFSTQGSLISFLVRKRFRDYLFDADIIFFIIDLPSETALRTFILVAKSLQNLANLVEFGTKVCNYNYFLFVFFFVLPTNTITF